MASYDFDSTLLRRGRNAITFTDMVAFAQSVETRPLMRVLEDLPSLAKLSETKFVLAMTVLRQRFRGETPVAQSQLRQRAREIAAVIGDQRVAERIRGLFGTDLA